jgi:hypothetical protein
MSDLKPLGSEKLQGDDKLKRIMEIANYGRTPKSSITESTTSSIEFIKESTNGIYGIVREKDGYYVKKGLTESSLDYIGGIFMKNKNKFTSYSEALKRLELISGQETLSEGKKYILKKSSSSIEPAPESATPSEQAPAPVSDIPAAPAPAPAAPEGDAPVAADPMGDAPSDDMDSEEAEEGKRSDYMDEVQKFSGKLGQALRDVKERMKSDDIKYVINMILSAVDLDSLDDEDKEEIAKRFEPEEDDFVEPSYDDVPAEEPESSEEIDEIMAKLESFVDTPVEEEGPVEENIDLDQFNDLGIEEEISEESDDEDVVLDLEELKSEINKHVESTLSKYFK